MKSIRSLVLVAIVLAITACAGRATRHPPATSPVVTRSIEAAPLPTPSPDGMDDMAVEDGATPDADVIADADALYPMEINDPWERYNRRMYRFNTKVDRFIARPVGLAYDKVVPDVAQRRITSFFANLREPRNLVNQLFQGHPVGAGRTLGRFLVNTTAGIGGLFDPATRLKLYRADEDFGQTLAVWGWEDSRYFIVPLKGPGTLRDIVGGFGDMPTAPSRYIDDEGLSMGLRLLQLGSMRAAALPLDALRAEVPDEYTFVRDAWLQRRRRQVEESR